MPFVAWVKKKIKNHDLYAKPITLKFKGNSYLSTPYGGLMSLMIKLVIIIRACFLTKIIFDKGNTNKSAYKTVRDLSFDTTKHYIGKSTFRIGLGFHSSVDLLSTPEILDESLFTLNMFTRTIYYGDDNIPIQEYRMLQHGACEKNDFPDLSTRVFDKFGLRNYV